MPFQLNFQTYLIVLPLVFLAAAVRPTVEVLWMTMPVALGLIATLLLCRWRKGVWRRRTLLD